MFDGRQQGQLFRLHCLVFAPVAFVSLAPVIVLLGGCGSLPVSDKHVVIETKICVQGESVTRQAEQGPQFRSKLTPYVTKNMTISRVL